MIVYFEDVAIGEVTALGAHRFTEQEIKTFARAYDPQPFHLDDAAAKASHFGALCASGWQTAAIWMRLMIETRKRMAGEAIAAGLPVPRLGPSPGFHDLKWLAPVYVGDTIDYTSTVIGTRVSASRPQWGLVQHHNVGTNQTGKRVFEFTGAVFWERRP